MEAMASTVANSQYVICVPQSLGPALVRFGSPIQIIVHPYSKETGKQFSPRRNENSSL